jgi:hypothetical protein
MTERYWEGDARGNILTRPIRRRFPFLVVALTLTE